MKKWIIIIGVIIIGVVVFFVIRNSQQSQNASTAYKTVLLARGELTAIVGATGTVRANQTTNLNWQTTGIIDKITVKVGNTVKTGHVLAELKESSLPQSIILAKADLVTAKRNLENLQDSDTDRAQAQQTLALALQVLDDAKTNRERKDYVRASDAVLDEARANYDLASGQEKDTRKIYDAVDSLPADDINRASAYSQWALARRTLDRKLAELNWLLSKPDPLEVAAADAQLVVAEANVKDAQREWERLKNGPDPQDIAAAEARISAIEATINLSHLDAPFEGTIMELHSKVGDSINPGTNAIRIDDLSHILVDVQIPEIDVNKIGVDQPADLTFDGIPGKDYKGKVTDVGRVGTSVQGVVNFVVTVELLDPDESIRPGMTSAVNVIVNQVNNVLLVPNRAVRTLDGKRVIYILRDGTPQPIEIVLGASSDTDSELVSGEVQEGELIVLNPPVSLMPSGGNPGMMRPGQ